MEVWRRTLPVTPDSLVILAPSLPVWVMPELLSFQFPARSDTLRSLTVIMAIRRAMITVNVEIFVQYIFSRISRRALDARKYDVSEKLII